MEFALKLIKDKSELEGACYFELMPRKYEGKAWNDDSVYLTEDSYLIVEPAFKEVLKNYDYFSFMTFSLEEVNRICKKLSEIISTISASTDYQGLLSHMCISDQKSFEATKIELLSLVNETKKWLESEKQRSSDFSLLGM